MDIQLEFVSDNLSEIKSLIAAYYSRDYMPFYKAIDLAAKELYQKYSGTVESKSRSFVDRFPTVEEFSFAIDVGLQVNLSFDQIKAICDSVRPEKKSFLPRSESDSDFPKMSSEAKKNFISAYESCILRETYKFYLNTEKSLYQSLEAACKHLEDHHFQLDYKKDSWKGMFPSTSILSDYVVKYFGAKRDINDIPLNEAMRRQVISDHMDLIEKSLKKNYNPEENDTDEAVARAAIDLIKHLTTKYCENHIDVLFHTNRMVENEIKSHKMYHEILGNVLRFFKKKKATGKPPADSVQKDSSAIGDGMSISSKELTEEIDNELYRLRSITPPNSTFAERQVWINVFNKLNPPRDIFTDAARKSLSNADYDEVIELLEETGKLKKEVDSKSEHIADTNTNSNSTSTEETTMTQSFASEIKSDLAAGATRFGARKINELGRDAVVNLISEYMDADAARHFARFLTTELGEALLSFGISQLIKNIPIDVIKKNKYFTAFARELSINGCDIATGVAYEHGEMIFNTMLKPMLSSLGKIPGIRGDKEFSRVVEKVTSADGKPEEITEIVSSVLTGNLVDVFTT
jgi:translation initiation factor 2B subunit (eIF-2B alpha/beta/delta family)